MFNQTAFDFVGTAAADTVTGSAAHENFAGGAGNDVLVLNSSNIAALSVNAGAGITGGNLARVDGGTGTDTLRLDGMGISFNLATVRNIQTDSRIESVERIDLTGSVTNNSQTFTAYNHASSAAQVLMVDLVGVTLNDAGLGAL